MDNIIRKIQELYPVSDDSLHLLKYCFKQQTFPAKTIIIQAGRFDNQVYFIEKGITRSYILHNGKEITTWFSMEGDATCGSWDLYRHKAGFEYVETLEETLTYSISIDKLNDLYKSRIDKNTAVINSQIQFADSKGVSFESLMALRQAVVLAEQNRVYMSVLAGINNNLYRIVDLPYVSAGAVRTLMQRMQEELPVAVSVSGDPSERISTALSSVFAGIGLKTIEDVASAPLILAADFSVVPIEGGTKYKYVRFVLNVSLTEQSTGKELLSFSRNGREAHVTQNEAKERAIRTAEELIISELSKALKNLQLSAE